MVHEKNDDAAAGPTGELVLASDPGLVVLTERLVAAARTQGVQLTGSGGLSTALTKQVLETSAGPDDRWYSPANRTNTNR